MAPRDGSSAALTPKEKAEQSAIILSATRGAVRDILRAELEAKGIYKTDAELDVIIKTAEAKLQEAITAEIKKISEGKDDNDNRSYEDKRQDARFTAVKNVFTEVLKESGIAPDSTPDSIEEMARIYSEPYLLVGGEVYHPPRSKNSRSPLTAITEAEKWQREAAASTAEATSKQGKLAPVALKQTLEIARGEAQAENPQHPIVYVSDTKSDGTDGIRKDGERVYIDMTRLGKPEGLKKPVRFSEVTVTDKEGSDKPGLLITDADGFMIVINDEQVVKLFQAGQLVLFGDSGNFQGRLIAQTSSMRVDMVVDGLTKHGPVTDLQKPGNRSLYGREARAYNRQSAEIGWKRTFRVFRGRLENVLFLTHDQAEAIVGPGSYDKSGRNKNQPLAAAMQKRSVRAYLIYTKDEKGRTQPVLRIVYVDNDGQETTKDHAVTHTQAKKMRRGKAAFIRVGDDVAKVPLIEAPLAAEAVVQAPIKADLNPKANAAQTAALQNSQAGNRDLVGRSPHFNGFRWQEEFMRDITNLQMQFGLKGPLLQRLMAFGGLAFKAIIIYNLLFAAHMPLLIALAPLFFPIFPVVMKHATIFLVKVLNRLTPISINPKQAGTVAASVSQFLTIMAYAPLAGIATAATTGVAAGAGALKFLGTSLLSVPTALATKSLATRYIQNKIARQVAPIAAVLLTLALSFLAHHHPEFALDQKTAESLVKGAADVLHADILDQPPQHPGGLFGWISGLLHPQSGAQPDSTGTGQATPPTPAPAPDAPDAPPADAAAAPDAKGAAAPAAAAPPADSSSAAAPTDADSAKSPYNPVQNIQDWWHKLTAPPEGGPQNPTDAANGTVVNEEYLKDNGWVRDAGSAGILNRLPGPDGSAEGIGRAAGAIFAANALMRGKIGSAVATAAVVTIIVYTQLPILLAAPVYAVLAARALGIGKKNPSAASKPKKQKAPKAKGAMPAGAV